MGSGAILVQRNRLGQSRADFNESLSQTVSRVSAGSPREGNTDGQLHSSCDKGQIRSDRDYPGAFSFAASILSYRARRYGYMSQSATQIQSANSAAPRYAQTPELASLVAALQSPLPEQAFKKLRALREHIVGRLRQTRHLTVLDAEIPDVRFVDSIVSFYLNDHPRGGSKLKEMLSSPRTGSGPWDSLPITIPAIVTADKRDYMRIALDPRACMLDSNYAEKVDYLLEVLEREV